MPTILRRTVYAQIASQEFEAAERTLFDIQAGVCERLAREHPEQSETLRVRAEALHTKVGKRGADAAYLEALDAAQAVEPNATESARALISLGTIRFRQERYAYAERLLVRCLELVDEMERSDYSIRARASRMLAKCLIAQGRNDEAEKALVDAFKNLKDSLGPEENITLQVADDLRLLYQRSGRVDEANTLPSRPGT